MNNKIKSIIGITLIGLSSTVFADPFIVPYAKKGAESGQAGKSINIQSVHDVSIHNYKDHVLSFNIYYFLCAELEVKHGRPPASNCLKKEFSVNVQSGQNYHDAETMKGVVGYNSVGNYSVSALTRIVNTDNIPGYSAETMDLNAITVSY